MSFVYAEKDTAIDQGIIIIHSDTKIGLFGDSRQRCLSPKWATLSQPKHGNEVPTPFSESNRL